MCSLSSRRSRVECLNTLILLFACGQLVWRSRCRTVHVRGIKLQVSLWHWCRSVSNTCSSAVIVSWRRFANCIQWCKHSNVGPALTASSNTMCSISKLSLAKYIQWCACVSAVLSFSCEHVGLLSASFWCQTCELFYSHNIFTCCVITHMPFSACAIYFRWLPRCSCKVLTCFLRHLIFCSCNLTTCKLSLCYSFVCIIFRLSGSSSHVALVAKFAML